MKFNKPLQTEFMYKIFKDEWKLFSTVGANSIDVVPKREYGTEVYKPVSDR